MPYRMDFLPCLKYTYWSALVGKGVFCLIKAIAQ